MTMVSKYREFLLEEDVRIWLENLKEKSVLTETVALRNLGHYCEFTMTTSNEILEKVKGSERDFCYEFADFVRKLEKEGKARSWLHVINLLCTDGNEPQNCANYNRSLEKDNWMKIRSPGDNLCKESSAGKALDAIILKHKDWRGTKLSMLRAVVTESDPGITEQIKWKKSSNPDEVILSGRTMASYVSETY